MEYLDIRDPDGRVTGEVKERELVHRDGDLHGTVHIFVLRERDGITEVLLQKRSMNKDSFPGRYDISAAGHLSTGQDFGEAALRELEEEIGIRAQEEDLHFIDFLELYDEEFFHGKPFRNHELLAIYLYRKEVRIEDLTLQPEEVDSVRWMPFSVCREMAARKDPGYCLFLKELDLVASYL